MIEKQEYFVNTSRKGMARTTTTTTTNEAGRGFTLTERRAGEELTEGVEEVKEKTRCEADR